MAWGGAKRKYRNTPVEVDGLRFDSKAEARRWAELKLLERAGEITALDRQTTLPLPVNGVVVASYRPDFDYLENGERVVEDVKSPATRAHPVYRLKKKLVKAIYGLEIREVGK